jgi:DNA-damage-inducible protein J
MNGYVRARIDDDIIRVVLTRIAKEKAIPIGLFTPNATTIAAMLEAREIMNRDIPAFKTEQEMFIALEAESRKKAKD